MHIERVYHLLTEFYEDRGRTSAAKYTLMSANNYNIIAISSLDTKDHDGILPGKIKFYFDMILGVRFEIRGISYGGRLGQTLTVEPNIRLPQEVLLTQFSLYVHYMCLKPDSFYFQVGIH